MKFIKLHIISLASLRCFAFIGLANLRPSFFRFNSKRLKKVVLSFIFLFAFAFISLAQYSNVKVSNTATANGTWSALTSGTYTFTPNSDNANILYTDIQTKLLSADVKIITTNGTGTQVGNVNITNTITAPNNTITAHTFYIQASGDINVANPITLSSSYTPANNINFTATGNISINAAINTAGWVNYVATTNGAAAAGSITLNASGKFYTSSAGSITATGGNDTYYNYYGYAGAISITGTNGVSTNANISNLPYNNNTTYAKTITINDGNSTTTTGGGINDGQVAGMISGVDFIKNGSGTFIIKNTNTYIGTTTINEGTLKLGSTNTLPTTRALVINGGTLNTGGFSQTVASISITDNSTMIMPSSVHTLTATAIGTFTAGKTLTINGWEGTYTAPGATATKGKIIINGTALNATILSQIKFYNAADATTHSALQLGTKEVVAGD
jgi:autotransporter-associated beta strand protein